MSTQFYVDDLLVSDESCNSAIDGLTEMRQRLCRHGIKLCKICSNDEEILAKFQDTAVKLPKVVEFSSEGILPIAEDSGNPQTSSLGLTWNTESDTFQIKTKIIERPYTKRGLLGHLMSPFDPPGFISPAMIKHKLLQRMIAPKKDEDPENFQKLDWDDPLSECLPEDNSIHTENCRCGKDRWNKLIETLRKLDTLVISLDVLAWIRIRRSLHSRRNLRRPSLPG